MNTQTHRPRAIRRRRGAPVVLALAAMLVTLLPGMASAESGVGTIVDHYLEGGYGVVVEAKFQAVPDSPTRATRKQWRHGAP